MKASEKIKLIERIIDPLYTRLGNCDICPRNCKVNRLKDKKGFCGAGADMYFYIHFLHQGEEPAISTKEGSGTIFFTGCSLKCAYCQNYKFSHFFNGREVSEADLAKIMLDLQKRGAANINLVTPTHFLPQILKSLLIALKGGLKIPIVYNTSGYEKPDVISKLDGIIDVYLADLKYLDSSLAKAHCNAPNYPEFAQESLLEMHRQCGKPCYEGESLCRGLVVRHLVLPNHIEESKKVLRWVKQNLLDGLASVMFQYRPYYKAKDLPDINRPLNFAEYRQIKHFTDELNIQGWVQDFGPQEDMAGVYFKPEDME